MANGEPQNFSHLTAEERFFVARNRLARTSSLVTEVIRLNEQTQAFYGFIFSTKLFGEVVEEREVPGDVLITTIVNYEVVQVCRLWDKFDAHGGLVYPQLQLCSKNERFFP